MEAHLIKQWHSVLFTDDMYWSSHHANALIFYSTVAMSDSQQTMKVREPNVPVRKTVLEIKLRHQSVRDQDVAQMPEQGTEALLNLLCPRDGTACH